VKNSKGEVWDRVVGFRNKAITLEVRPFIKGDKVYHPRFGHGEVLRLEAGANMPVVVVFDNPILETRFTADGNGHTGQKLDRIMHYTVEEE
jgi:hypothetical protein